MRRSKQTEAPPSVHPSNVNAAVPAPRPTAPQPPAMTPELSGDDLERGRTTALIATLGRVQLTLDLIERRLGRVEEAVAEIRDGLAEERAAGMLPAELPYLDAVDDGETPDEALEDAEEIEAAGQLYAAELAEEGSE